MNINKFDLFVGDDIARDRKSEKAKILDAKIELKLLSTLGTQDISRWLPDGERSGNFYITSEFAVVVRSHTQSFKEHNEELMKNVEMLKAQAETMDRTAVLIDKVEVHLLGMTKLSKSLLDHSQTLRQNYLNICEIMQQGIKLQPERRELGSIIPRFCVQPPYSLIDLYISHNRIISYESAITLLADEFNISDDLFEPVPISKRSEWEMVAGPPYAIFHEDETSIIISGLKHTRIGRFAIKHSDGMKTILPCTYWRKCWREKSSPFCLPGDQPYPLLNLNLLYWQNPKVVFVSDSLEIAARNQASLNNSNIRDKVWTSWYGEKAAAPFVDWKYLQGKKIYYFLIQHSGFTPQEIYDTALTVYAQLRGINGIILRFVEYRQDGVRRFKCYSPEKFLLKAQTISTIPVELPKPKVKTDDSWQMQSLADLTLETSPISYFLEPVIKRGSINLLHGAFSAADMAWMGLSIGTSIALAKKTFDTWQAASAQKVLYLEGSLGCDIIRQRLKVLSQVYVSDKPETMDNFKWHSLESDMLNLADEGDQAKVKKLLRNEKRSDKGNRPVSILILSNMEAMLEFRDNAKSWQSVLQWLQELRQDGYSVLLIQPGEARNLGIKAPLLDTIIRLKNAPPTTPDKLAFSIQITQGAETYGAVVEPFIAELDFQSARPGWSILNETERENKIIASGTLMKWTDKQIGKVLGLHVQTIKKRREKLKLNKNNRNPEAKELRKAKLNKRNEDIKECFSSGKSIEEITQTYRLKVNTVKKILGMIPQEQSSTIHSQ